MKGFRPDRGGVRPHTDVAARRAYTELRRRILSGELEQGAVISEVAVSQSIGVSRTPLREAFRELLNEGMLAGNGPRRQVTVRILSPDDVVEVLRARRALEPIVASGAAKNADDSVVDELRLIAARMQRSAKKRDVSGFFDADDEFHAALSAAASVSTVEDFLSRLRALSRLEAMAHEFGPKRLAELHALHARIVDVLADRRAGRSRALADELDQCATALASGAAAPTRSTQSAQGRRASR
jgi:DNA-binding GntR family transcriptional regulator